MEPIIIESSSSIWPIIIQSIVTTAGMVFVIITTLRIANLRIWAGREDKWWDKQHECFTELRRIFSTMYTVDDEGYHTLSIKKSLQELENLGFNAVALFENESLDQLISDAVITLNDEKDKGVIVYTDDIIEGVSLRIDDALKIMSAHLKKW